MRYLTGQCVTWNQMNIKRKTGGELMLISRDFKQLLPIIEKSSYGIIVQHILKYSYLLDDKVRIMILRENMRIKNESNK